MKRKVFQIFIYIFKYLYFLRLKILCYIHICLTKVKAREQMSMCSHLTLKVGATFRMNEKLVDACQYHIRAQ